MRFWIGKEKEGRYKGVRTLFVQSSILDDEVLDKIEDILKKIFGWPNLFWCWFCSG